MKLFPRHLLKIFIRDTRANPAIESAFLFPVLVSLLCGVIDTGVGLIINMKVTNASQVVADLVSRQVTISDAEIDDAIIAGSLTLMPYDTTSFGVDVAGVQYVGVAMTPTVMWRETQNMDPNQNILTRSAGLGGENEGVVAVSVRYVYTPYFSSFMLSPVVMTEEAYVRGRKGLFISKV